MPGAASARDGGHDGTIVAMPAPRRPVVPGGPGRRPSREQTPSGPVPHAGRTGAARPAASPRPGAPRPARPAPRSGPVPKVAPVPGGASRPGANRPAGRPGSTSGAGARPGTPARGTPRAAASQVRVPRMFTVRTMVFSLVVLLAFVLVYPTLSSFLQHRAEVDQLRAERDAAVGHNEDLEAELRRWDDPAYVMAQARERLSFVMPGETAFRVVDPETVPDVPRADDGPAAGAAAGSTAPWYSTVWESVRLAGGTPADAQPGTEPADPAGGPPATPAPQSTP